MDPKELEKTLGDLDARVDRLRALYEQYFMGIEKLEPQTPRKEVDRIIAQFRKIQIRNTALRFRFQTVVQRYNTMQQHWGRTLREMENGTYRRDLLRAAERFGVEDALTAVGKKRAKKLAAVLDQKKKQHEERDRLVRKHGGAGDEYEAVSDDDIVEEDDDDDAPTPPPVRARPAPNQVWELNEADAGAYDPSFDATYVPPGVEPARPAAQVTLRPQIGAFGRLNAPASAQPAPAEAIVPTYGAPPPSAPGGVRPAPAPVEGKKAGGGLRIGGGPRRANSDALSRIASALGADPTTAPPEVAPAVTQPPPQPARKPLLSQPLDIAVGPEPPAPAAPPPARKPLLSQPLDIDVADLGPAPPPKVAPAPKPSAPAAPPPAAPKPSTSTGNLRPPPAVTKPPPSDPSPRAAGPAPAAKPAPSAPKNERDLSDDRLREIYGQYVKTRRDRNESTVGLTFEKLSESLRSQADKLREKHDAKKVDYEVVVKDGKTLIKPIVR